MRPNLERLSPGQRTLWEELSATPEDFTLYGGVAISLRFGHRFSDDFDFFSWKLFDPEVLIREIPYLRNATVLQMESSTLTCSVEREGPVKVSFFALPHLGIVHPADVVEGPGLKVASPIDLAGTKAQVVQKRATSRDYLDLDILMTQGRVDLLTALASATVVYGPMFNPQITLKALTYFGDGDLPSLPGSLRERLLQAVRNVDLEALGNRITELKERR